MCFSHVKCGICVVALSQLFSLKDVQLNNSEEGCLSAFPCAALWVRLHLQEEGEKRVLAEVGPLGKRNFCCVERRK